MPASANILSRKLSRGGLARSPLADTDLLGETFARGVEDRLRPMVKTIVGGSVLAPRVSRLGDAVAGIETPAVLALVEIEDADTPGLIALGSDLAYHLVDLTLGGDPAQAPSPMPRPFSAIDLALCRLHLDAVLSALGQAIGASLGRPLPKALTIRDLRQNVSQLRLAPNYIDVMVLGMELALGEGGRRGGFSLILPLSALDVLRASVQVRVEVPKDRPNDLWKTLMRRAAASAPVRVDAVLHRTRLSVATLQTLKVGQVIEIPRTAVEEIELALQQPGGRTAVLARGRLGAYHEAKVVKLGTPPDARVVTHIDRALRSGPGETLAESVAKPGAKPVRAAAE